MSAVNIQQVEDGSSSVIAEYYYDPFGRRLWKDVGGNRTYYAYASEGLIGEYDSAGSVIKSYGYLPDSTWSTNPLFQKIGDTYYWYKNDHSGTPKKLMAENGLIVWSATYDSFGNCLVDLEGVQNNLRFPGQYFDAETGLNYNLNRYYDPTTGRYLRTDPQGDGLNLYTYVYNNPANLIDPLGLCAIRSAIPYMTLINDIMMPGRRAISYLTEMLGNAECNNWFTQFVASSAFSVASFAEGILYTPEGLAGQLADFLCDPGISNFPIIGTLATAIGESIAEASLHPSVDTICKATENTLYGVLLATGGVKAYRGMKGGAAAPKNTSGWGSGPNSTFGELGRPAGTIGKSSYGYTSQGVYWEQTASGNVKFYPQGRNGSVRVQYHPGKAVEPGETYNPRHHGEHWHVESKIDPSKQGWKNNTQKSLPPGYQNGSGTGFSPGEGLPTKW